MKLIQPHQHKLNYFTFFDDPKLFYSVISAWLHYSKKYGTEIVEDEKGKKHTQIKQPIFVGDDSFNFRCKKGMTWRKMEDGSFKRNFEYEIKLRSRDNMRSYYISFSPEISKYHYGLSDKYGDYQQYKLKKRLEGVNVQINTVNYSYEVGQEILKEIMKILEIDNYWDNQRLDMGVIKQCEFYIRYNSKYENKIGSIIEDMNKVIGLCGNDYSKITRDRKDFKYMLFSFRSNRFDELGFNNNEGNWSFAVKTYRALEYHKFQDNEPLAHPKLEVFLDEQKRGDYPDLIDFFEMKNTMYQIIANIITWAKIKDDSYIIDSYFDNEKFIEIDFIEAKAMYEKLKKFYESLMPEVKTVCYSSNSFFDYLRLLSVNGQMDYNSISKKTGFGKDWIRKLTYKMESLKIIKRIRSVNSIIQFHSNRVMEIVKSIIKMIEFEKDLSFDDMEERKEKRIKSRKNRKIKLTILEQNFIKKSGIRLLAKIGIVNKVNGGLYRLQNVDFLKEKPQNYKQLVRDYG